jgi:all-trans-retinol 13,14-reductase
MNYWEVAVTDRLWLRRDFTRTILTGLPLLSLDWDSLPTGPGPEQSGDDWDAVIIGAGLGGLSCAAAFARQGFKPLVMEQHVKAGGYATTFTRPGGFVFDVSLHSTTVEMRNGLANLIPGFPEIEEVTFVPHPNLGRAIYPDHDIRIPQQDLPAFIEMLCGLFPQEKDGITSLFEDMNGLRGDIDRYQAAQGQINPMTFPQDFPYLFKAVSMTWGEMVDAHLSDPRLKAIVSWQSGYYGLPPSRLSCFYYALPVIGYLTRGGYYPRGRSQAISDALVRFIETRGGRVMLGTRVEGIETEGHAAVGVRTGDGRVFRGRVVVSNANAWDTFHRMLPQEREFLQEYLTRLDGYGVSFSIFQVFLGLKSDLVGRLGITDSEIHIATGYDPEQEFRDLTRADTQSCGYGVTLYDNIYAGYSPPGKNTIILTAGQGYDFWEPYESDYLRGDKEAYRRVKERMADELVQRAEEALLPGLAGEVEVREVGTPLTNLHYTSNYRGAVYGWDQTVDNSGGNRLPPTTPITGLYLAGAWTFPGGGYGAVIPSGLACFTEIMRGW